MNDNMGVQMDWAVYLFVDLFKEFQLLLQGLSPVLCVNVGQSLIIKILQRENKYTKYCLEFFISYFINVVWKKAMILTLHSLKGGLCNVWFFFLSRLFICFYWGTYELPIQYRSKLATCHNWTTTIPVLQYSIWRGI